MSKRNKRAQRDPQHESQLIAAMLAGDEAAFNEFFNTYYRRLKSFAARRSSLDAASIEDVVQTTLIKSIRRLSSFRGDAALSTWLCTICWRELITQHREERSRFHLESLEALSESQLAELCTSAQCEPERVFDADLFRSSCSTAMRSLPMHYARALEMKYVEGRAVHELAEALGLTSIGAQSLLARARRSFSAALRAVQPVGPGVPTLWRPC